MAVAVAIGDGSQSNNRSSQPTVATTTTSPSSSSQPRRSCVTLISESHSCPVCNSEFVLGRQLPDLRLDPHNPSYLPIMDSLQPHDILRSIRDSLLRLHDRPRSPAPKVPIDAIPDVDITEEHLCDDPQLLCAICKDEFVLGSEPKRLPCSHIFHGDCVLPWLSQRNSCPICRFKLPTVGSGGREEVERRLSEFRQFNGQQLSNAEAQTYLSHLFRNNGQPRTARREIVTQMTSGMSPTQLAEVVPSHGPNRPTNSVETVTSSRSAEDASSHMVTGTSSVSERIDEESDVVVSVTDGLIFSANGVDVCLTKKKKELTLYSYEISRQGTA